MELETVLKCPFGDQCKEIKDNKIHRCVWLVKIAGQNPQTGEQIEEEGCAMALMPMLLIENSRVSRGTSASIESFRNEMVDNNSSSNVIFSALISNLKNLPRYKADDDEHIGS
jgi:hypothetical protein